MSDLDDLKLDKLQTLDLGLWSDFAGTIDYLAEKCAAPAADLREAVSSLYTRSDIGIYWNPAVEKAAMYVRNDIPEETEWCREALIEKLGAEHVHQTLLTPDDLQDWWVKVAYSPTLRRLGELLQFFPSKDIPGFGGRPIASTVASGLVGAGLGYGTGWLAEKVLPEQLQGEQRMRHTGALMGGLAGTSLGAMPGLANWHEGRTFNDPTLMQGQPDDGFEHALVGEQYKDAAAYFIDKHAFGLDHDTMSSTVGGPSYEAEPLIRTNDLGQVLWGTRANPQTTAMTMGAVYGAGQMYDPRASQGIVTPHQTGLFGMALGAAGGGIKGYVTGYAVGKGLGLLTGMPQSTQNGLMRTGAMLGIINSLVPRLFS